MSYKVGDMHAELDVDQSKFKSGLASAEKDFNSFGSKLKSGAAGMAGAAVPIIAGASVAAGLAVAGAATLGVKSYMDIESAASDAASKMDLSAIAKKNGTTVGESFENIKQHVISVSRELGQLNTNAFDPNSIAVAMANLAAGGFDVAAASAKDLTPILSLATATNYGLDRSAETAMATMNQYGLGVGDLGHISDVYTKACGDSAAGMEDLAVAMQYAGPVAKGAGVSFETVTANLETFAASGIKGEKAGTAMVDVMNTLLAPSSAASKGIASLGMSLSDVDPRTKDLNDSLAKMKEAADKSGRGVAAFTDIFGIRGGLIYGLAGATAKVDTFEASLLHCDGAAEEMAKMMLNNLKGSFDAATGAAIDLAIGIGERLSPSLKGALDWFSGTGAPAIRAFLDAIAEGKWGDVGNMISAGLKAGWSTAINFGKQIYDKLKGLPWGGLWNYITGGIKSAWGGLKNLGGQLLGWLQSTNWGQVGTTVATTIINGLSGLGQWIYDAFTSIDWAAIPGLLVDAFKAYASYYSSIGKTIYDAISKVDWSKIGSSILDSLKGIAGSIQSTLSGLWDQLGKVDFGALGFKLATAIRNGIATLSDIGGKIAEYVTTGIKSITSVDWSSTGTSVADKIKGGLETLKKFGEEFKKGFDAVNFTDVGSKIATQIKNGVETIKNFADSLKKDFQTWIDSDGPKKLGEDFAKFVAEGAIKLGSLIKDKIVTYWKGLTSGSNDLKTTFKNVFEGILDWGKLAVNAAYDFAAGFGSTILKYGKGTIGAALVDTMATALDSVEVYGHKIFSDQAAGLKTIAENWRSQIAPPEGIDTSIDITQTGDPLPKDGDERSLTYNIKLAGVDAGALSEFMKSDFANGKRTNTYNLAGTSIKQSANGGGIQTTGTGNNLNAPMIKTGTGDISVEKYFELAGQSRMNKEDAYRLLESSIGANEQIKNYKIGDADWSKGIDAAYERGYQLSVKEEKAKEESTKATEEVAKKTEDAAAKMDGAAKSMMGAAKTIETSSAKQEKAADTLLSYSQQGATSLKLGAEVGAKFTTDAGNAVKMGMTASGQEIAVIGKVAQEQFAAAGGKWATQSYTASEGWKTGVQASNDALKKNMSDSSKAAAGVTTDAAQKSMMTSTGAATTSATKTTTAAGTFQTKVESGAAIAMKAIAAAGDPGTKLLLGAQYAASALVSAGQSLLSMVRNGGSAGLSGWDYGPSKFANGIIATSPTMGVFGEAGAEALVPLTNKEAGWKILKKILPMFGMKMFAEGGVVGSGSAGAGTGDMIVATLGLAGLDNMAKSARKTLIDLQNNFRITWSIIKADLQTYWTSIKTWYDGQMQAIGSVVSSQSAAWRFNLKTQMIGASADTKAIWLQIVGDGEVALAELTGFVRTEGAAMIEAFTEVWNNMGLGLTAFSTAWANTWKDNLSTFNTAASAIHGVIQNVIDQLSALGGMTVSPSINAIYSAAGGVNGGGSGAGGYYSSPEGGMWDSPNVGKNGQTSYGYDPRDYTCGGLPFNMPDPSLKTSDPFYIARGAQALGAVAEKSIASGSTSKSMMGGVTSGAVSHNYGKTSFGTPLHSAEFSSWGKYANSGIAKSPQMALIAEAEPEVVLTKSRFWEMMGGAGGKAGPLSVIIEKVTLEIDGREFADVVMKRSITGARINGLSTR
jgi:TP901 family phage tail tape measure protein